MYEAAPVKQQQSGDLEPLNTCACVPKPPRKGAVANQPTKKGRAVCRVSRSSALKSSRQRMHC